MKPIGRFFFGDSGGTISSRMALIKPAIALSWPETFCSNTSSLRPISLCARKLAQLHEGAHHEHADFDRAR